ncbi:barstar family protein [Dyadobacter sp.]|uniref:barstar family protein n=1 Tax=Dyadobacter sp. TaxID=1914288 RepID=UPI003F70155E
MIVPLPHFTTATNSRTALSNSKQIVIDGNAVHDIPSFYDEVNRAFMQGEDWILGASLDAFSDLLFGGFGAIKGNEPVELVWLNQRRSREVLGFETTKAYYTEKLAPDSPFNKTHFTEKLKALESGEGQTYFDIILEIIAEHPNIKLIIRE